MLALFDATFLVVAIMAIINIREWINGFVEINASFWMSVVVFAACISWIVGVLFFIYPKDKQELQKSTNKKKCGYVYKDLEYKLEGKWALAYPILSQSRLLLLAFTTIYLRQVVVVQVLLIFVSSVVLMSLLGFVRPVKEPLSH